MIDKIQNRIISIALPLSNGKHEYFSGFIIANELVITCRHGFDSQQKYDTGRPLKILSQTLDEKFPIESSSINGLIDDGIIVFESSKYDIALLKLKGLDAHNYRLYLDELHTKGEWSGGGYPYFNREDKVTNGYKNLSGDYEAVENKSIHISLVPKLKLAEVKHWKEASGSPVFIENRLAGILQFYSTYKDENKQTRQIPHEIKASYLKRLWDDPNENFKNLIQQALVHHSSFYKEKIQKLLDDDKSTKLKEKIKEYCKTNDSDLINKILKKDKQGIMDMCLSLNDIEGVESLLLYAIAYQYENDECFNQGLTEEEPYINVPVVRVEACEFLMAAEDQREPLFQKVDRADTSALQKVIPGKYSITSPPVYGIDSNNALEGVMDHLLAGKANLDTVQERLFGDYRRSEVRKYTSKEKIKVVTAMLESEKGTYYWLLQISNNANASNVREIFHSRLPIKILNMNSDIDVDMSEEKLFANLDVFIKD